MDSLLTEDEINNNFYILCNIYDPTANIQPNGITMSIDNKLQQLTSWTGVKPVPTLNDLQIITKEQINLYKTSNILSNLESECKCNLTVNYNTVLISSMIKMFWLNSQQVFPNKTKEQFISEYSNISGISQSVFLKILNNL